MRGKKRILLCALLALSIFVTACGGAEAAPIAKFATGNRVLLKADTPSLILFTRCGSPFGRLAGVANSGDEAVILTRELCSGSWWYRVQVPALKNEDWQGIGWVAEENLETK